MTKLASLIADSPQQFANLVEHQLASLVAANIELTDRMEVITKLLESGDQIERRVMMGTIDSVPPGSISIDMRAIPPCTENLYPCEFGDGGGIYRWTGPGKYSRIPIYLDRTFDKILTIHIAGEICDGARASTEIYVDGYSLELILDDKNIVGRIPANHSYCGKVTVLEIHVPSTTSVTDINGNGDSRLLGLAIEGIDIQ